MPQENPEHLRVLVVDDETIVRRSLAEWFEEDGHEVESAGNAKEALNILREKKFDTALVDIKMPGMDGLQLMKRIQELNQDLTVIIMTAYASVETAVQALKEGAYDYITKPFDPDYLTHLVRKAAERRNLVKENLSLKQRLERESQAPPILGKSAVMRRVIELISTVAPTDTTVLCTGESGTGKELVARAIHAQSPRSFLPLVAVNCGALPEGILESELFGHERGAFTGAQYRHKGKFELADGGSLFLDEIAEISPKIQVELLRVLEEKKVTRLGGTKPISSDFRTIAATNKDLLKEVHAGRFREDLYYRLNVFHIELPPLRARQEDIPILANALLDRFAKSMNRGLPIIHPEAMKILEGYEWPGNVRELANAMERAMVVQKGDCLQVRDFPIQLAKESNGARPSIAGDCSLEEMEKTHIQRILHDHGWNITQAAKILKIDRTTVYNKIKQYGLQEEK